MYVCIYRAFVVLRSCCEHICACVVRVNCSCASVSLYTRTHPVFRSLWVCASDRSDWSSFRGLLPLKSQVFPLIVSARTLYSNSQEFTGNFSVTTSHRAPSLSSRVRFRFVRLFDIHSVCACVVHPRIYWYMSCVSSLCARVEHCSAFVRGVAFC